MSTPNSGEADKQDGRSRLLQTPVQSGNRVTGLDSPFQVAGSRSPTFNAVQPSARGPSASDRSKPTSALKDPLGNSSCQCFTSAMSLLETLAIADVKPQLSIVAHLLHMKKRAVMQCNMLLDCPRCSSVSSFMVLLIVLCQKIIASYERVLVILTEQYNRISQRRRSNESDALTEISGEGGSDDERQIMVKDYDLDPEEQPCVFGGLASLQLRRLVSFLARMRHVLKGWNWDPHIKMVDSVETRVRAQLRLFDKDAHRR